MRAALYLRQSLDRDGTGLAVARQRDACAKLCAERGWQPVEYVDNDTSASSNKARPAYTRLLADVAAGALQAVVVWDLDRLHRQPIELEEFMRLADRRGLALATVTGDVDLSTDNGRLFARIKGAVARAEVERKSARQKAANQQRASMGRPRAGGLSAVGYDSTGVTVIPHEAELIRSGYSELLAGASLRSIAGRWNAEGFTTSRGGAWRPDAVRYTLRNLCNAGLVVHLGEEIGPGTWSPIVPEEIYRAAVALLDDPSRRTTPTNARRYLLAGLARCHCGAAVITGRNQHGTRTYRCGEHRGHLSVAAEPRDEYVAERLLWRLERSDASDLLLPKVGQDMDVTAFKEEREALRVRLDEASDMFSDGEITRAEHARMRERMNRRLDEIKEQLACAGDGQRDPVAEALATEDLRSDWDDENVYDLDRRRALIDALMTVTFRSPGQGARTFGGRTVVEITYRRGGPVEDEADAA